MRCSSVWNNGKTELRCEWHASHTGYCNAGDTFWTNPREPDGPKVAALEREVKALKEVIKTMSVSMEKMFEDLPAARASAFADVVLQIRELMRMAGVS